MGKKSSSSAPKIDASVGRALEKQAEVAERQQDWYENEIYPWLQQQTTLQNKWSQQDRQLAQQNQAFWQNYATEQTDRLNAMSDEFYNRWKENYLPIENALLADAKNYNTSAEAERQAGEMLADSKNAFAQQRQAQNMQMQAYGINPTAGAYQGQNRALDLQQSAMAAAAANQARTAARELGWNKQMQVAALGQQYIGNSLNSAQAATGAGGTAGGLSSQYLGQQSAFGQLGTQNITNLANVGLNSYQSLSNAWGQYGNLGMQASNYNLSAWGQQQQAQANSAAGIGSMVGAGVTTAAIAI